MKWRALGCIIPRPGHLWPQGRVHATYGSIFSGAGKALIPSIFCGFQIASMPSCACMLKSRIRTNVRGTSCIQTRASAPSIYVNTAWFNIASEISRLSVYCNGSLTNARLAGHWITRKQNFHIIGNKGRANLRKRGCEKENNIYSVSIVGRNKISKINS